MHIHIFWFYCSLLSLLRQLSFESSIPKALFVPFGPLAEHQQLTKGPWLPSTAFSDGIYENRKTCFDNFVRPAPDGKSLGKSATKTLNFILLASGTRRGSIVEPSKTWENFIGEFGFVCFTFSFLLCQFSFSHSMSEALFVPFVPFAEHQSLTKGPLLPFSAFNDGLCENRKYFYDTFVNPAPHGKSLENRLSRSLISFCLNREPDKGGLLNLQKLGRILLGKQRGTTGDTYWEWYMTISPLHLRDPTPSGFLCSGLCGTRLPLPLLDV